MMKLPYGLTSWGVGSDKLGDVFHIFFMSCHTAKLLYFGDNELTEDLSKAITTTDMSFITDELTKLLDDKEFLEYLSDELAPF